MSENKKPSFPLKLRFRSQQESHSTTESDQEAEASVQIRKPKIVLKPPTIHPQTRLKPGIVLPGAEPRACNHTYRRKVVLGPRIQSEQASKHVTVSYKETKACDRPKFMLKLKMHSQQASTSNNSTGTGSHGPRTLVADDMKMSFLQFPAEIRRMIYEHYLPSSITALTSEDLVPSNLSLLSTCSAVYAEASVILYTKNPFHIADRYAARTTKSHTVDFLSSLRPETASLIKVLTIDWRTGLTTPDFTQSPECRLIIARDDERMARSFRDHYATPAIRLQELKDFEAAVVRTIPTIGNIALNIPTCFVYLPNFHYLEKLVIRIPSKLEAKITVPVSLFGLRRALSTLKHVKLLSITLPRELEPLESIVVAMGAVAEVEAFWDHTQPGEGCRVIGATRKRFEERGWRFDMENWLGQPSRARKTYRVASGLAYFLE